jgi:cytochrome c-type biogenesis protein CcmH
MDHFLKSEPRSCGGSPKEGKTRQNLGFFLSSRLFLLVVIVLAAAALWSSAALAQGATPSDDEVNAIARQLYCPVCENIPLDVCPTQACAQWRALIREKLGEGWSEQQIKQYFVEQYGARVLNEPPREGWNWLIYILPLAIIVGGGYVVFRLFRSAGRTAAAGTGSPGEGPASGTATAQPASGEPRGSQAAEGSDEYLSRFEEEAGEQK